jgi:L-gulono-1,4-lactone dehydrogenase
MRSTAWDTPESIRNFGGNIAFSPAHNEVAKDEAEVVEILQRRRGCRVRARGSLHSWSQVAQCDDVSVDVSQLNQVRLHTDTPNPKATVGAGCQINHLVAELDRHGWTTPTLGLIKEQTLAGATATATHGSGRHCLSHNICSLRLATYDAAGNPVVRVISEGEELRAACCSLGSMGIVTEITLPIRKQYSIEEHFREYHELESVMDAEDAYPIQQFFFVPWKWSYLVQHRRESPASRSWHAPLYRAFWAWGMDHGLHWAIIAIARWLPDWVCPFAFRFVLPRLVPRSWRVVDRSDRQLTMQHQLYRHIETELFVKKSQLAEMLEVTQWLLEKCAGQERAGRDAWTNAIAECGMASEFEQLKGCYRHHYPICIRKVLADKGLITMSGSDDDEPCYAVSFISYAAPDMRAGFLQFAGAITRLSIQLFSARPHGGKHYPATIAFDDLYANYDKFLEIRDLTDPTNAFLPVWLERQS